MAASRHARHISHQPQLSSEEPREYRLQGLRAHGLAQQGLYAETLIGDAHLVHGGHGDDLDAGVEVLDLAAHLEAVHLWHVDVCQNQFVELRAAKLVQPLHPVRD